MDEYEKDEAPEDSVSEPESSSESSEREERPSEPESSGSEREEPEERPGEPEPEEPEEPAPEPEPEAPVPDEPPSEGGEEAEGDKVQDLIDAIGDLNQTITGAVTEEPAEQLPAGGDGTGGDIWAEAPVTESSSVDLTPVVKVLETMDKRLEQTYEVLEHQDEVLVMQHNDLLQLQANVSFVFLAVCMLAGVVIGCAVSYVLHDLWRA